MEKTKLALIPLVFFSFSFCHALTKLETSSHQKMVIFQKIKLPGKEESQLKKRLVAPVQSEFLQKTKTDILSFPLFPPPVVSKDVQRNGTIVKSESHLHVSDSCSGARETV